VTTDLQEEEAIRPTVLLVEDNPTVLHSREEVFRNNNFDTVIAENYANALAKFRSTPSISILATDINLDPEDAGNRDGLKLAEELHSIMPALPMVALSGVVTEHAFRESKRATLFKDSLVKGADPEKFEQSVPRWREWAVEYLGTRLTARDQELLRLKTRYQISDYDFDLMREFIPLPLESAADLDTLVSSKGYRLHIIEMASLPAECVREGIKITKSIPLWIRKDQDSVVAEVYGFPQLYASGSTEEEATQLTMILMHEYYKDFKNTGEDDQPESALVRQMRQYLNTVFSSN
jgi:CheY-like chemotaxis protein